MAQSPKLCRHLHLPLQSASPRILKLMRRPYSIAAYSKLIHQAVRLIPDLCIGTDLIVGFPGETDLDFKRTLDFLSQMPIHYAHVFSYSQRKMAKSKELPSPVTKPIIQKRSRLLRTVAAGKRERYGRSQAGKTVSVLFEQKKGNAWLGLTDNFLHIQTTSMEDIHNQFRRVRLLSMKNDTLRGEILKEEKPI